jgi:hypothetical protein
VLNFQAMAKKKLSKIRWRRWVILPLLAAATFLLAGFFARHPAITEKNYSGFVYPPIASVFSRLSSLVPFSLDDVFYISLLSLFVILLILLVVRRLRFARFLLVVMNGAALVYILFYLLWGYNYFRSDLNTRLSIPEAGANIEEFKTVLTSLVTLANEKYTTFDSFSKQQTDSLVEDSYRQLAPFLKVGYPMGKRKAKNITFSRFFASAGISGYFGPFFNEVHVNTNLLPVEYPVILAHEKAHQFGVTNEAEANFYAWLVCSQSPSPQLQYSAHLYILNYFLYEGRTLESIKDIVAGISPEVRKDISTIQNHWKELRNEKVDRVATKANNIYLKTNHIEEGIKNYTGVVKLVMNFSVDKQAQERLEKILE